MRPDLWNILEPVEVDPRVKSWKDVLRNLVFHANDTGEAWPNIETIRREVGYKSRKEAAAHAQEASEKLHVFKTAKASHEHYEALARVTETLAHELALIENARD